MRDASKAKLLAIFYVVNIVIFTIPIFYVNSIDPLEIFDDWEKNNKIFYERLTLSAQAEFGLILILSVFYLGKIHDHRRDYTNSLGNLYEIVFKFKKKFPLPHGSVNNETYKMADNALKDYKEIDKALNFMILLPISFLLLSIGMISIVLFSATFVVDYSLQNDFVLLVLLLALTFAEFVVLWGDYEVIISTHRLSLRGMLFVIATIKAEID